MCREIEGMCSVENTILLRQVGLHLYQGKKDGQMVYVPVRGSSVFTQCLESRKIVIVNEPPKERDIVTEVRKSLNFEQD